MNMRTSRSLLTFPRPFSLTGYPGEMPAGIYEVVVEEELLQGLSSQAWRRTATYLLVQGSTASTGRTEMRATSESDLTAALSRTEDAPEDPFQSNAGLALRENAE